MELLLALLTLLGTLLGGHAEPALTGTDAHAYSDTWGEVPVLPWQAYMPPHYCEPVPVGEGSEVTDEALTYLVSTGWHGDPADGMEALYPVTCGQ